MVWLGFEKGVNRSEMEVGLSAMEEVDSPRVAAVINVGLQPRRIRGDLDAVDMMDGSDCPTGSTPSVGFDDYDDVKGWWMSWRGAVMSTARDGSCRGRVAVALLMTVDVGGRWLRAELRQWQQWLPPSRLMVEHHIGAPRVYHIRITLIVNYELHSYLDGSDFPITTHSVVLCLRILWLFDLDATGIWAWLALLACEVPKIIQCHIGLGLDEEGALAVAVDLEPPGIIVSKPSSQWIEWDQNLAQCFLDD
ncbi:hypothetical protein ACLOJK_018954 [Asimina triloba]